MKLKLREAFFGYVALQRIGAEKMPIKLSYQITRNMRILEADARGYESKRTELVKGYNAKNENGDFYVPEKSMNAFTKKMEQLGEVEIEVGVQAIPMDEVTFEIAPNDLILLAWMFTDENAPKPARKRHK